jgi:hypothetical protein
VVSRAEPENSPGVVICAAAAPCVLSPLDLRGEIGGIWLKGA